MPAFCLSVRAALLLCSLMLVPPAALAATSLSISPLSLKLLGSQRGASLTVRNVSATAATFRMEVARWTQDTREQYEPTGDVIVNPSSFRLAPGQVQTIRVALRGNVEGTERSYRVFLQELPPAVSAEPAADATVTLTTLYRVSVPMLVLPSGAVTKLAFTLDRQADTTVLTAVNTGTRYAFVGDLVFSVDGKPQKVSPFNVLAGGKLAFPLPGNPVRVTLNFTQQDVPQTLTLTTAP